MNKHFLFIIAWIVASVGLSDAQPNGYVSHYEWWGRLALNKTIHAKFKMEAEYQHRRQNLHTDNYNALAGTSMNSVRLWGYYQPIKNLQVNFSPFAFFATQTLAGRQNFTSGLEYRWAVSSEVTSPFDRFNIRYRIGYESRYMKSSNEHAYHLSGRFRARYWVQWQVKEGKPLNIYAYDDVFINHDRPRTFDHNRMGLGFVYTGIKKTRIDISYNWMFREQNHYYDSEHVLVMMFYYLL